MNRLKKRSFTKRVLIGLPILMFVLLVSAAWWLLGTASGAAWIWGQVEEAAADSINSSHVSGDFASGFSIHGLEYRSGSVSLSVNRVEIEVVPGWSPLSVQVRSFVLRDVDIISQPSTEGEQDVAGEMDIPALIESLKLRVPVNFLDVEASNVTFRSGDEAPRPLFDLLSLSAGLGERLILDRLEIQAPDVTALANGQLGLKPPFNIMLAMQAKLQLDGQADGLQMVFPVKLDANGDLDGLQFLLASTENGLVVGDELLDLRASGSGSPIGLHIDSAALTGPGVDLDASGTIGWSSQPSAGLKLAINQLDISNWMPAWPVGKQMVGEFDINWSESGLKIPTGSLGVAGTDISLHVAVDIDLENNAVDGKLDWSNVAWPLAAAAPEFSSPLGKLDMQGSLDDWSVGGILDVRLGEYPQGRLEIEAKGNLGSAEAILHAGEILGGSVRGEASADWENGFNWELDVQTRGIDPEPLLPGWPGKLGADLEVVSTSQPEEIRIRVASLEGLIRGVPINGQGGFTLAGESMAFEGVVIRTQDAELLLDGDVSSPAGTTLKFNGQLPSMLLQGAAGHVELEGQYSSTTGSSLIDVQLKALDLAWNGFGIKSVAASTKMPAKPGSVPMVQIEATGLAWQEVLIDELALSLNPDGAQHRLDASLANETLAISSSMLLAPGDNNDLFAKPWQGVLDDMVVAIDQSFSFQLQEQAPLKLSPESILLGPACMREDAGAALCVNADYQANAGWSLLADVKALPLNYLRDALELNVHFEQFLEGSLAWHQPAGEAPTGGADFRIAAGRILDLDDNDVLTETSEGRFGFVLQNGNLESGILDLELQGTGFIDVDFDVLDIIENGDKELQGRAIARMDNLALVGQLAFPVLDELNGQFDSELKLGGSLEDPTIEGTLELLNGRIRYAPIGLDLTNVAFKGRLEKHDRGILKGGFKAGEGSGLIDGKFSFEEMAKIRVDATFSGENLLLVNTDDLKIYSAAELRFGFSPERTHINGYIRVPSARLTPTNLVLEKETDSEDLVITTRAPVAGSADAEAASAERIFGQLEVTFGDDVLINVPGIETSLSGSVIFGWNGDPVPVANGRYNLQGNMDVYGPTLEINNGRISFPGVLANNPLLNIRAEREVYGNTQIHSAGVQLIGSLKRPVLEAYTVPITNEDRAWALLITGTDFDQGQGVGGFDVGTYIAPKLYVSYGISLFDDENIISARYDLKKGFGVKVSSGQRETGVDISYTIDR